MTDDGDPTEDFVAGHVVSLPKRVFGDPDRSGFKQRGIKIRAMIALQATGKFSTEEIALAVGYTDRHVRRKRSMLRQFAEAQGRV